MNIEEFREYCLSFKGVHEKMPFPNVPDQYFVASNVTLTNLENCKLNMPV